MTITDAQIRTLRREAAAQGDMLHVVICDIALDEMDDITSYALLPTERAIVRRGTMSRDKALATLTAINDGRQGENTR